MMISTLWLRTEGYTQIPRNSNAIQSYMVNTRTEIGLTATNGHVVSYYSVCWPSLDY